MNWSCRANDTDRYSYKGNGDDYNGKIRQGRQNVQRVVGPSKKTNIWKCIKEVSIDFTFLNCLSNRFKLIFDGNASYWSVL